MNTPNEKITLDDLLLWKQELKKQIEDQQQKLIKSYHILTEPFNFNPEQSSLLKKLATGFAIFDGFMIGFKIIRKIKNIFRRRM